MKNENIENTDEFETEYDTLDPLSPARNGKLAALSRNIREALNRRIRHGQPGLDILEWLNAEPSVVAILEQRFEGKPITRHNLFEWRHGGYTEWARHRAARIRLQRKQKEGKGLDRHQLGEEMAQLYAEELTDTLDELIDFAPDPEVRMQRLERGLNQIRGWRRSDYQAQRMALQTERMALDKQNSQWRRERETQELAERCTLRGVEAQALAEDVRIRRREIRARIGPVEIQQERSGRVAARIGFGVPERDRDVRFVGLGVHARRVL